MSELIFVNFKTKAITSRQDLDVVPVTPFKASKDEDFRYMVEGIALAVETAHSWGGDQRRVAVVVQDTGSDGKPYCMTIWDDTVWNQQDVNAALQMSLNRNGTTPIDLNDIGNPDEPA